MATAAEQPKENQVDVAGSVFINNTSYSGCDIKVVFTLYGTAEEHQKQIDNFQQDLTNTQKRHDLVSKNLAEIEKKLAGYKPGSPEWFSATNSRTAFNSELNRLEESISALEKRVTDLSKQTPNKTTKVLAELQTLSVSLFRDKQAVRACGSVYPKGFTRGQREIAGSCIFTVFDQHVLYEFLQAHPSDFDSVAYTSALMDQLPPVDIVVTFANEYGSLSRMAIYGVEFMSEGQVMSIEDLLTENTVNFVARDFDPMRVVGKRKIDEQSYQLQKEMAKKASDLIFEDDYKDYKDSLDPFTRLTRRRNPFL